MATEAQPPRTDEQKLELVEKILQGQVTFQEACTEQGLSSDELKAWVRVYRREARRLLDDRVRAALSTQGLSLGELESAEFSGSVEELGIAELIQTMALGRKDAEIVIDHDGRQSRIWCVQGSVIDAECGQLIGGPAVYRLLALARGRLRADFVTVDRPRTINVSTQALLLESARRSDECQRLRETIGELQSVYVPSSRAMSPAVEASPTEYSVLRLLNGSRTLEEVVQDSLLPDLETLEHLLSLRARGLMEPAALSIPRSSQAPPLSERKTIGMEEPVSELTFAPFAATLGTRSEGGLSRRLVWASVGIGATALGAAVALRFSDVPGSRAQAEARLRAQASHAAPVPAPPSAPIVVLPAAAATHCPDGSILISAAFGAYCLDRFEVTVQSYAACAAQRACEPAGTETELPPAELTPEQRQKAEGAFTAQCNASASDRERHPVNCVSYADAEHYCHHRGGRVPTEAEWDWAANGGTRRAYPWGDAAPTPVRVNACGAECRSWYRSAGLEALFGGAMYEASDGFAGTAPVGSFPEGNSPEGVSDLVGNVAEWTSGRVRGFEGGPDLGNVVTHVVRGGAFSSGPEALQAPVLRFYLSAEARDRSVGFRCAYSPTAGTR